MRRFSLLAAVLLAGAALVTPLPASGAAGTPPDDGRAMTYEVRGVRTVADTSAVARTGASVDHVGHGRLTVTATRAEARAIQRLGFRTESVAAADATVATAPDPGYHDYDETAAELSRIATGHPSIARRLVIGKSFQNRDIYALKISDNVGTDEDEPEVLFTANQHAREHLTVEQALYLANLLTDGYGGDSRITRLVDGREFWIIPMVNPDGAEYDISSPDGYLNWRKNRQPTPDPEAIGTDLNRNWGYKWGCCGGSSSSPSSLNYRGTEAFSAPETAAVRDFVRSRRVGGVQQITAAIDFHAYSELVLWPFGYTYDAVTTGMTADQNAMFKTIGQQMARTNGYTAKQASEHYITDGMFDDWLWGDQGIVAYAFEMYPSDPAVNFYPPSSVIPAETARNREAALLLSEYADCPYRAIGKASAYCATPDDFTLTASPASATVTGGNAVTTTITTATTAGDPQQITLGATGLPPGATVTFNPATVTTGGSATMTIQTASSTPSASYAVAVSGTGPSGTRSTIFGLGVDGRPECSGSNGGDLTIGDLSTVTSPITITGCTGNASAGSSVEVHIVHSYIGDLTVALVAPDGTAYVLQSRSGGGTDNIDRTYPVDLSGEVANGTWKLRVTDAAVGDVGYLDSWSLSL